MSEDFCFYFLKRLKNITLLKFPQRLVKLFIISFNNT